MEPFKQQFNSTAEAGFTLIEVLIAIMILTFVAFSTYKMLDSNLTTKDIVLKEDRLIIQSVTAIGRLDSDISQLYTPLYSSGKYIPGASPVSDPYADTVAPTGNFDGRAKNGQLIPQFKSEDKSSIVLFTQANRRKTANSKESRFAWIRYSLRPMEVEPGEEVKGVPGQELVRQVIATDVYSETLNWNDVRPQILMRHIKSMEFSFWDERGKKFVSSIQDLNENKNLIRAIKLDLVWVDEDQNEQVIQKIFRVLHPYFNTKQDDLKLGTGSSALPGGISTPTDPGPSGADGAVQ